MIMLQHFLIAKFSQSSSFIAETFWVFFTLILMKLLLMQPTFCVRLQVQRGKLFPVCLSLYFEILANCLKYLPVKAAARTFLTVLRPPVNVALLSPSVGVTQMTVIFRTTSHPVSLLMEWPSLFGE